MDYQTPNTCANSSRIVVTSTSYHYSQKHTAYPLIRNKAFENTKLRDQDLRSFVNLDW
ncbi:MAG: hypothetical protein ACTS2F_23095 [Thainema sp.]